MAPQVRDTTAAEGAVRAAWWPAVMAKVDALLQGWPRLAAVVCGALSTLAMPPVFAWPVLFAAFYGLVRLIDEAIVHRGSGWPRARATLAIGWLFGFGYFATGLYWISASLFVEPDKFLWLLPFSATLIPAGLAIFFGLAVAAAARAWHPGPARIVALALALTIAEWLRGHVLTGLPWNVLGYALTTPPLLMQSASLIGTYALTFLTVLIFALPAVCRDAGLSLRTRRLCTGMPLIALALLALHGAYRLSLPEPPVVAGVRLRLIQPNVSQDMKWRHENRENIFRGYLDLSQRNPKGEKDGLAGITHVIWPESAIPFLLLNSSAALEAIAGLLPDGTNLITGAIRLEQTVPTDGSAPQRQIFNSILSLDDRARLTGVYDKLHLVPFGEYLPFQKFLEAIGLRQLTQLQGGFATGQQAARYLELPGLPPASPLICYESIFPDEVVTRGHRPAFFLNVTNDGWFGRTAGPHQHFHQARVRAVEQGLPLVRVANTGVSGVIDGRGSILQRAGLGQQAVIDAALPSSLAPTPYSRFGELLLVLMLAGGLSVWFYLVRHQP
jgi:apolipoprotein N-acyltransferase